MNFLDNKKQIAPCIISHARYELGLKSEKPNNKKECSEQYWKRTIETLAKTYNIKNEKTKIAINNYKTIFK